jgi:hypothetical protein
MDRQGDTEVIQALNQFAVTSYVQYLAVARYQKITLFSVFPYSGAPNLSEACNILMVKELPGVLKLFGKNAHN